MSPDQHRNEAERFCRESLVHLCKEMVDWVDKGVLGEAPLFRRLCEMCKLYAGVEYGRKVAENMVRTEAMRAMARGGA